MKPIRIKPRHDTLDAMQFQRGMESAYEITHWLLAALPDHLKLNLKTNTEETLNRPATLSIGYANTYLELTEGDWLIWDGVGFTRCSQRVFPLKYCTPLEKISMEAGL